MADDALYNLAWSHLNMERVPQAIAAFQSVVADYPGSALAANAQFTIGDFYYNEKEYDKALQAYQEVLRRFPSSPVAQKVPELIDDLREVVAYLRYAEVEETFAQALEEQDPAQFRQAAAGFAKIARDYPGTESEIGALSNMGGLLRVIGAVEGRGAGLRPGSRSPSRRTGRSPSLCPHAQRVDRNQPLIGIPWPRKSMPNASPRRRTHSA